MAKDPIPPLAWPAGPRPSLTLALLEGAVVSLVLAAPLSIVVPLPLLIAGAGLLDMWLDFRRLEGRGDREAPPRT